MENAPRILESKRWRENMLLGNLNYGLSSPELQIYSIGTQQMHFSCQHCREQLLSRGICCCWDHSQTPCTQTDVLPCVQVTPGSVHLQLRFRGRVFRTFQPYSQINALLEVPPHALLNLERFAWWTAHQAHTVVCLRFHSGILYTTMLEIALGY